MTTDRRAGSRRFLIGQLISTVAWIATATLVIAEVDVQVLYVALAGVGLIGVLLAGRGWREAGLHRLGPKAVAQASAEVGLRPQLVLGCDAALFLTAVALTVVAYRS